jgi:sulfonate transport system substrate-binding protein
MGRIRRALALLATAAMLAPALAGCGRPAGSRAADGGVVLRIASQRGGTRALMEAAGVLDGAPYRIEWSEFPSAQTLLEALGAQAVDAGAVSDAPFLFAYASGAKIKAVHAIRSSGSHGVAVVVPGASSIRTPADLKGRRIATGRGSVGHYFLLLVLEQAHLKPSDVTVVYLAPGDAKAALAAGSVDAWVTWTSFIPLATLYDHARVLIDSRELLDGVAFEAASDEAISTKRAQLDDFLRRLARAERWEDTHADQYAQVLAKDTGLPLAVARATVAQRGRSGPVPIDAAIEAQERRVLNLFQAAGLIDRRPDVHAALDPSFNDSVGP